MNPTARAWRRLERDRHVFRVEGIPDPALDEHALRARANAEVRERIRVLSRHVEIVVLERAVEHHLGAAVETVELADGLSQSAPNEAV